MEQWVIDQGAGARQIVGEPAVSTPVQLEPRKCEIPVVLEEFERSMTLLEQNMERLEKRLWPAIRQEAAQTAPLSPISDKSPVFIPATEIGRLICAETERVLKLSVRVESILSQLEL